jgi:hypothetical protein
MLLAVLPLVEEEGKWKVDLPIFEGPAYLPEVLVSPLPEEASGTEDGEDGVQDGEDGVQDGDA